MPPTWKRTWGHSGTCPSKYRPCTSPIFLVSICDLSRNISVVPNPQFPFNTEFFTTSTFRDPLDSSSLHPYPGGTSPVQWHESSFMDTITFLTVVSDSKTSVTSATLTLIWPSHIDWSLVPPFPSTTTANSTETRQTGDMHAFSSHGYYCVVRRHEFISLPPNVFPPALLQNMCLLTSPASSTSSTPSFLFHHSAQFFVFFPLFHFFSLYKCGSMSRYPALSGPVEDGQVL